MTAVDLSQQGITVATIHHNLPPARLYELAILDQSNTTIAANGALVAYSGDKTGRSPRDKRIVESAGAKDDVWWGQVNIAQDEATFAKGVALARKCLNTRDQLYVVDGFAGWDPKHRIKVRVIAARPYHTLFMWNMLIRPTAEELADFGDPEAVIYNAGQFTADHVGTETSVALNLETKETIIFGTEYAGEMKKGIFTLMNYLMPKQGVASMHCSATCDPHSDRSSLLFGLSGTGKTTLSADPQRLLVGDDEHCWTDDGIFNIEGGCYAKMINLSPEGEPDIYQAMRFGAVMENVVLDERRNVDYADVSITENTRGAYPIEFIDSAKLPCVAGHPTDIIFLTCDAFGVLPPVSKLTPPQAMYHFVSGYTAKVAGTEQGVTEPQATFSPCFGGPFLVWHPVKYAVLLKERIKQHNVNVWLVNTGWTGGAYGTGSRIKLRYTRSMVDGIHDGTLRDAPVEEDPIFGLHAVTKVIGVPDDELLPRRNWPDTAAYETQARKLAQMYVDNFQQYNSHAGDEVQAAAPKP